MCAGGRGVGTHKPEPELEEIIWVERVCDMNMIFSFIWVCWIVLWKKTHCKQPQGYDRRRESKQCERESSFYNIRVFLRIIVWKKYTIAWLRDSVISVWGGEGILKERSCNMNVNPHFMIYRFFINNCLVNIHDSLIERWHMLCVHTRRDDTLLEL